MRGDWDLVRGGVWTHTLATNLYQPFYTVPHMYVLPIKEQDYTELLDSFKHIFLILASVKSY